MPRTVTDVFREASYSQETAEVVVPLLTISHPSLDPTIRLVRNAESITSDGQVYLPYPFDLVLPNEQADALPTTTITIDNISREIVIGIRKLDTPPTITVAFVVASDPDHQQMVLGLTMIEAKYDQLQIVTTLAWEKYLNEPFPAHSVTPGYFPAVFAIRG